jgi:hypothetical protein
MPPILAAVQEIRNDDELERDAHSNALLLLSGAVGTRLGES